MYFNFHVSHMSHNCVHDTMALNDSDQICKAEGTPQPKIKWTREDKKPIIIKRKKKEGKKGEICQ